MPGRKKPKKREQLQPKTSKIPTPTISEQNNDDKPPIFSLEYMVAGYSVADCNHEQKAAFASALWERSKMTWREIRTSNRHGLGSEVINRGSIQPAIPASVPEDVRFLSLRFHGMAPMIGFREGRVLHIVWLDHNYTVYSHS